MINYIKRGWNGTLNQRFLLVAMFVYHFLWGFILYRYVSSVVNPLMHRFPDETLAQSAVQLFFAESQFRIMKTNLSHPYLWLLLGLLLCRMIVTPLLNAGIFFSLHHTRYNAGYRFFKGIKSLGGPFFFYYLIRLALTSVPLCWIVPAAKKIVQSSYAYDEIVPQLFLYLALCLVYGYVVHIAFVYAQLAKTTENSPFPSIRFLLRHLQSIAGVSVLLLVLSGLVAIVLMTASLVWAGLAALILYQVYRFVHVFCKIWTLSSHYQLWMSQGRM